MKTTLTLITLCAQLGGHVEQGFKCPKTFFRSPAKVCYFDNSYGETLFTDGCTGPTGGHKDLFLPACVQHDLCYHHEPLTSGKTRRQCDDEFLEDLETACIKADNEKRCRRWAKTMVATLRPFGGLAYKCEDKEVREYDILPSFM